MKNSNVVRAWRDYEFQEGLSDDIKNELPANPAGATKLALAPTDVISANTYQGNCSTFMSDSCDTFMSGCCSTFMSNTCSTFMTDCCS